MRHPAFVDAAGRLRTFDRVTVNPMWNRKFSTETYESPSRYVSLNRQEEVLPLEEAVVRLLEAEEGRAEADQALAETLRRLGLEVPHAHNGPA